MGDESRHAPTSAPPPAKVGSLDTQVEPLLREYCFDCHGDDNAEANVNLEAMVTVPDFARGFKTWEKVIGMVREQLMPSAGRIVAE